MPVPAEWNLSGKVALVAGNGRGWAPLLASALAEAGARVAVACAGPQGLEEAGRAVAHAGGQALLIRADVSTPEGARTAVGDTVLRLGALDILVNNSAVEFHKPFMETEPQEFRRLLERNLLSVVYCCREAGRHMLQKGKGRIINITSVLAERGLWNSVAFCATMGAVAQLTRALALEWARQGIRVNAIGPGWMSLEELSPEAQREIPLARYLPSRRLGHPRELGPLLVYLASDACDFVTGQTIYLDGGALAHP